MPKTETPIPEQFTLATFRPYEHFMQPLIQAITPTEESPITVELLQTVSPEASARVLWESILTDEQKTTILNTRALYEKARTQAAEIQAVASGSYKDPAFLAFLNTHPNWQKDILQTMAGLDIIEKTVIGNYARIPAQTKKKLQDPSILLTKSFDEYTQIEAKKHDKLRGYVVDVATIWLIDRTYAVSSQA